MPAPLSVGPGRPSRCRPGQRDRISFFASGARPHPQRSSSAEAGTLTETDPPRGPLGHVVVIIPTYNEHENLDSIVARVRGSVPEADVLVVDDNSPDGTGELADKLGAGRQQIFLLHRPGKAGLGAAYIAGFGWALERGYAAMVEMDADGSHQPQDLPRPR